MWQPLTEAEINDAVNAGTLEETTIFEAKRELPKNNVDLAIDVAAMANEGGVIIYGIGEDSSKRLTLRQPMPLKGVPERIQQIVHSSISESLQVKAYPVRTEADPTIGYVVLVVPQSERAPHMVEVKGDHRFYGRTDRGNKPLSQGEVARLYERRSRWAVDRDAILSAELAKTTYQATDDTGYLVAFARPVSHADDMVNRVTKPDQTAPMLIRELVSLSMQPLVFRPEFAPRLQYSAAPIRQPYGYILQGSSGHRIADNTGQWICELRLEFDGTGHFFSGHAVERLSDVLCFMPTVVAGNATTFLLVMGELHKRAGYVGQVDIGIAVVGIKNSVANPYELPRAIFDLPSYPGSEYRRTAQVSAEAISANPKQVAKQLLAPLLSTYMQDRIDLWQFY